MNNEQKGYTQPFDPTSLAENTNLKIEAVVVCVDYSDFLEATLPSNLNHIDRLVVVTHPRDQKTQDLCRKFGVDVYPTEVMHEEGDKFNKGRMINYGLQHLRHDGWLIHMDADTLLPHRFKQMLHMAKLEQHKIYGIDRLNTKSYENWKSNEWRTIPQHQYRYMVTPQREFPLGSRLLHQEYGYAPIGYFQLWHSKMRRQYPIVTGSAEHSDVMFAVQWERKDRVLLPELFVYHLESEDNAFGKNWQGRKTKPFEPEPKLT